MIVVWDYTQHDICPVLTDIFCQSHRLSACPCLVRFCCFKLEVGWLVVHVSCLNVLINPKLRGNAENARLILFLCLFWPFSVSSRSHREFS